MGSLYIKGSKLWARYKDEHGVWKGAPTPYRPGDEANARRFLKARKPPRSGHARPLPLVVPDSSDCVPERAR
jgi:hypothetical protein